MTLTDSDFKSNYHDNTFSLTCDKNMKEEILKDQEDAKAYNDLMNANAQVVKDNINITKEHQIVERLKKRIEALEEISQYDFAKGRVDSVLDMQIDDLQKIVDGERIWTPKHTKIAKESDERFKLHTKDQEVDI